MSRFSPKQRSKKTLHQAEDAVFPTREKWLTDEERQEMRAAFVAFAAPVSEESKETALSVKQAKKALKTIGISLPRDEIQTRAGDDGSNVFNWSDFSKMATTLAIQRNKASLAFSLIDQDQKGVIVLEDLRRVADDLGEEMTDEELQEMIEEFDQVGDGLINMEDFVKIARQVKL